jgi:hypothetical protein
MKHYVGFFVASGSMPASRSPPRGLDGVEPSSKLCGAQVSALRRHDARETESLEIGVEKRRAFRMSLVPTAT